MNGFRSESIDVNSRCYLAVYSLYELFDMCRYTVLFKNVIRVLMRYVIECGFEIKRTCAKCSFCLCQHVSDRRLRVNYRPSRSTAVLTRRWHDLQPWFEAVYEDACQNLQISI
jgi:hypothetical protein